VQIGEVFAAPTQQRLMFCAQFARPLSPMMNQLAQLGRKAANEWSEPDLSPIAQAVVDASEQTHYGTVG